MEKKIYKLSINLGERDLFLHIVEKLPNNVVLVYKSDAGPQNCPKLITFVNKCVVYD
jgi:hypothetical protein